ncbi:hypothetical protein TNIN_435061 [Trichonephila inaurata madagascariensis]|uniref:Uncharacterized protein n=1 Tax=Trichonephila inaurata madagascariensis TaxID=2747483 RepID=A0A8X6XF13_9ARAC|nr:hypothetical protein TNIN_435061 [Trichonephila inaurata madagascariensis]
MHNFPLFGFQPSGVEIIFSFICSYAPESTIMILSKRIHSTGMIPKYAPDTRPLLSVPTILFLSSENDRKRKALSNPFPPLQLPSPLHRSERRKPQNYPSH